MMILVACLYSCQSDYTRNETILRAEALMYASPDSSYALLTSIKQPEKLSQIDYAAWCLQYTYAQFKLHKEVTSDSLLQEVAKYYENRDLPKYSGAAYFLLGNYYSLSNKNKEAMVYFKQAEKLLEETNEVNLKGLVAFHMGSLCSLDEYYHYALGYFRESLIYFKQSDNNKYKAYAYREIANMYNHLNYPADSVSHYLDIALDLSKQMGDSINYYSICISEGDLLLQTDCYKSKEFVLKGYNYFPAYVTYYSAYLANAYSQLGKLDSAKYYLKIALADTTQTPYKMIGYYAAALIAKRENNYKEAYKYLEKTYDLRDSTYKHNMKSQLYEIDKQYDLTQKETENAELKIYNRNMIIMIALLIIIGLTTTVVFLLINNKHKKKHAFNEMEKQQFKHEAETTQINNAQKKELLGVRLQHKIDNTLHFNKLNRGYLQKEKMETFMQEIALQSIIAEKEWPVYVDEVDSLFENRITDLKWEYAELTMNDLIVIALIGLKVNIVDACSLLDMTKNTMYNRRRIVKERLKINDKINLEQWITDYLKANIK